MNVLVPSASMHLDACMHSLTRCGWLGCSSCCVCCSAMPCDDLSPSGITVAGVDMPCASLQNACLQTGASGAHIRAACPATCNRCTDSRVQRHTSNATMRLETVFNSSELSQEEGFGFVLLQLTLWRIANSLMLQTDAAPGVSHSDGTPGTYCRVRKMREYNEAWCAQSSCCAEYILAWMVPSAGPLPETPQWTKLRAVRDVLLSRRRPVVWIDLDAFIVPAQWCPFRDSHERHAISIMRDHHSGRHSALNTGFFAVRYNSLALRILDAWWDEKERQGCYKPGAPCHGCLLPSGRASCPKTQCLNGGPCDDQGVFNSFVRRHYGESIEIFPEGFQDFEDFCTDATVKHVASSRNWSNTPHILSLCGAKVPLSLYCAKEKPPSCKTPVRRQSPAGNGSRLAALPATRLR